MVANFNEQTDASASGDGSRALQVPPSFHLELTALANGYCTGIDLIGAGDMPAGIEELRLWFADHVRFVYTFPPKYATLNFDVTGPQAFARVVNELYRANGFVRTQHQVSNVRIERTGQDTATVRAYLVAVHVFPDERVFFATGKYVDAIERINGQWKIVHRDEPITSCALLEAFPVG
jgi:SnoaL-like domain